MTHRNVCIFGYSVIQHEVGEFGMVYSGITGQEAISFLLELQSAEIRGAFHHPAVGYIDLVFGFPGKTGFGLAHIIEKHPEIILKLHEYISKSKIIQKLEDRIILLYEPDIKSIISLTWHDFDKKWLVTAYEKLPE